MTEKENTILQFGQELVNARNYKGLSLEQIAEITKIAQRYLLAMEEGQWDALPKPYMEAFLKSYAECVGMNVPKVMKKYREMVIKELVISGEAEKPPEGEEETVSYDRGSNEPNFMLNNLKSIILAAAGIVLIIIFFVLFKSCGDTSTTANNGTTSSQEEATVIEPEQNTLDLHESLPSENDTQDQPRSDEEQQALPQRITTEVNFRAIALERCWLRAVIDQDRVRDVFLYPDETITLKAEQLLHVVIGNAGGLKIVLSGDSLGTLGPKGEPVTLVISPEGIQSQKLGAWQPNYESEMQEVILDLNQPEGDN
ncbi:hypothetical protein CEE37_04925 [candidate division LCP-89 bacterium B3_LCP]|uniref:Cytoskeleton protein RodZ-like C-terminal domain-containing protein n=1 Tax=candidate division LCP-89 bacterium B3_LCP TaxID=2012998 RepID=A0A532V1B8_UNCL8|nr:MAG: hypothetical protein CEE37_04925 [candidate division LCP-89 bacterium B3_LCP]